ncbi:MAG: ATP-dependent Clp protease ATP-binding subunit [Candidatus Hydrogenedentes bacterium]|nr:ATP-dependent Clp protease ATP-binding subunit [Candidatus Hydrogenedentota bacterium]
MIVINEESQRWLRELARFSSIKNVLFLYGNTYDLVSFPVQGEGEEEPRWSESDLPGFLRRWLMGLKYEIVGWADPLEDLSFLTPEMEALFDKVLRGTGACADPEEQADRHPQLEAGRSLGTPDQKGAAARMADRVRGIRPRPVDWDTVIHRIGIALQNPQVPCAFIVDFASRLTSTPDRMPRDERMLLTRMLKASLASREVVREKGRWNNLLILICEKLNDLPAFLYLNNPRARSIHVEPPDRDERARFITRYYRYFYGAPRGDSAPAAPTAVVSDFVDFTEGLSNYEMRSLLSLSMRERIPVVDELTGVSNVRRISEMYKYGVTVSEWDQMDPKRLSNAEDFVRGRIKGQEAAVARVLDIVKRAKIGIAAGDTKRTNRPRGVLFFAGPTGVGKTEMAKALAELLFGREERLIRFDMSEYSVQQADQRLLGAPPGYIGYEEGGQLTNAVKKNPFSVLLFDEIEKAHPSIFDKFLQILDDGRITDSKGDTVYFSECIIIFTSNLGTVARTEETGSKVLVTPEMPYPQMRGVVLDAIRDHFNFTLGRPEILNRFGDNFVVFDFIKPPLDEQIVDLLLSKLDKATRETRKTPVVLDPPAREKLVALAREQLHHGGRGIRNAVDATLINPLSRYLFDNNVEMGRRVRVLDLLVHGEETGTRVELVVRVEDP